MTRPVLLLACCVSAGVCGCVSSPARPAPRPAVLAGGDAEIRARLLAEIPVGASQAAAERVLKEHGLRCETRIDENTKEPFLWCVYSEQADMWVTWVWRIRVDCPGGVVSDIQCDRAGVGP